MRRPAAYSPSRPARSASAADATTPAAARASAATASHSGNDDTANSAALAVGGLPTTTSAPRTRPLWRQRALVVLAAAALLAAGALGARWMAPRGAAALTQADVDAAVLRTLREQPLPSPAAKAAALVGPSVVRVVGFGRGEAGDSEGAGDTPGKSPSPGDRPGGSGSNNGSGDTQAGKPPSTDGSSNDGAQPGYTTRGVGTGVVVVDKGVILTNLHVVQGAERIVVTFADGSISEASITGTQPENDLAVLQAHTIPDDLHAATLRSTHDLQPGDQVVAVGFPFGIGPSASAGVISGLKREFRSPEGRRPLSNLIQFDAAANPGNSGGPLVTMEGEVIGIVTAILNPTPARTFLGIAFAVPIENAASAAGMPPF